MSYRNHKFKSIIFAFNFNLKWLIITLFSDFKTNREVTRCDRSFLRKIRIDDPVYLFENQVRGVIIAYLHRNKCVVNKGNRFGRRSLISRDKDYRARMLSQASDVTSCYSVIEIDRSYQSSAISYGMSAGE